MTPEGKRLIEASTVVFGHLDGMVGDLAFAAHVDVLRRFVFGELGIPIGARETRSRRAVTLECSEREALITLFRIASVLLPDSRLVTPEEIEQAVDAMVRRLMT